MTEEEAGNQSLATKLYPRQGSPKLLTFELHKGQGYD